jgi:tyrosine-protein kinase Etk/Wzc
MMTPNDGSFPGSNGSNGFSANGNHNGNGHGNGNGNGYGNGDDGSHSDHAPFLPSQLNRPQTPLDLARLQRMSNDEEEKSKVNALDYLWLLWRGKWIILTCLLIAGLGTAYYTFSLPFVYQSSMTISVNDQEETGVVPLFGGIYRNPARVLQKELQVLTSRPVLEATAKELMRIRTLDTTGALKDSVIPVIVSTENALRSALRGISPAEREAKITAQLASTVQRMLSAAPAKDADIIQIVCTAGDPREAALIANVYALVYQEENKKQNQSKTAKTIDYLAEKMQSVEDSLRVKETDLRNFQESTKMFDGALDASSLSGLKRKFDEEIQRSKIQLAALNKQYAEYEKQLQDVEPSFAAEMAAAKPLYISQMTSQLANLKTRRELMTIENPVRASEVWYEGIRRDLDRSVDSLQKRLDASLEEWKNSKLGSIPQGSTSPMTALSDLKEKIFNLVMSIETQKANMAATQDGLAEVDAKIARLPEQTQQLNEISRGKDGLVRIYQAIQEDYNKKTIEMQSLYSNARIIEPALPMFSPISPNRSGNIMTGSIMGLAVGIGIVLLIAYTDSTVHSPDELEKNGFTVLSAIPLITENALSVANRQVAAFAETFPGKPSPHLITQIDMKSPIAESYRSLRTAVQFSAIESQVRSILVTSSIPQEGKSTTSTNLAIVIAQSGARTLLVDCDLRRPVLHSVFGISKDPGLVNALVGTVPLEEAIHKTSIPNLDLLPSGAIPPNPSELLGSRRMRMLVEQLKDRYDTVILDSPPVGTVTDSVVLSTLVDATLVIVRAHKTKLEFLEKTRESLERISTNVLGVVLNDFDVSQSYGSTYRYYRYYKYYGYYSQNEDGPGTGSSTAAKGKKRSSKKEKASA